MITHSSAGFSGAVQQCCLGEAVSRGYCATAAGGVCSQSVVFAACAMIPLVCRSASTKENVRSGRY